MDEKKVLKRKLKHPQSLLACQACRTKKVRCDMTSRRTTCSRCEKQGSICKIVPGRRRHLVDQMLRPLVEAADAGSSLPSCSNVEPASPQLNGSPTSLSSASAPTTKESPSTSDLDLMSDYDWYFDSDIVDPIGEGSWTDNTAVSGLFSDTSGTSTQFRSPVWPERHVRQDLFQAYANWVHPTLPMLDLQQLQTELDQPQATPSLLLLSVMLAASTFISVDANFVHLLRHHVHMEIGTGQEADQLVLLQTMVLMTYDDPGSSNVVHWLARAGQLAEQMVREGTVIEESDAATKNTFRSLLIRDTIISLSRRTPCQVRLQVEEASLFLRSPDEWYISGDHAAQGGPVDRRIENARHALETLCMVVRPILAKGSAHSKLYGRYLQPLQSWARTHLPESAQFVPGSDHSDVAWSIAVSVWSLTVLTTFGGSRRELSGISSVTGLEATELVSTAISATTALYQHLHENDLIRFVPEIAVSVLAPITIAHLLNTTSEIQQIRVQSTPKYYLCWQVLRELRARFSQAGAVMSMVDSLGQQLRQTFDKTAAERARKLRQRATSMSTSSPESIEGAVTPPTVMNDQEWLSCFSAQPDDLITDMKKGFPTLYSSSEKASRCPPGA